MFSKTSNAGPGASAPRSKSVDSSIPSLISGDLSIVGTLTSTGDTQVDGTVEGNLVGRAITIGRNASVQGDLVCETLVVYGAVAGTIRAKDVALKQPSKVSGDIYHESLSIEPGARFTGKVARLEDADVKKAPVSSPDARRSTAATEKSFTVVGGKDSAGGASESTTAAV